MTGRTQAADVPAKDVPDVDGAVFSGLPCKHRIQILNGYCENKME